MLNLKEIGNRIKKYRKQKGFTQAQLAEIIDISTIHMSHLETGSVAMSLECMIKVCNALEVSPDDLLIGEFELNNNATIKQLAEITKNLSSDENKLLIDFALLLEKNKPNRNKKSRQNTIAVSVGLLLYLKTNSYYCLIRLKNLLFL